MKIARRFYISLLVGLISLVIGMFFEFSIELVFIIGMIIAIVCSALAITSYWNKPIFVQQKTPGKSEEVSHNSELMISVSAALYAVLAGLSLVITTQFVFEEIMIDLNGLEIDNFLISSEILWNVISSNFNEILMGVGFLATAIPFYHGAMVYLSDKSRNVDLETPNGLVIHFSVLFIQAIVLIGIASSLSSLTFVITLLIFLTVLDSIWIIIGQKTRNKPPLGWLCLNLGFSAALLLSLHLDSIPESLYAFVGISIGRTIIDYVGFRKVYTDVVEQIE